VSKLLIKIFLLLFIVSNLFSSDVDIVPISNKVIKYKSKIYYSDVRLVPVNKKYKCKEYLDVNLLRQNKYHAKNYIHKDKVICKRNTYVPDFNKIRFKFGNLEIEREGTIIKETNKYIKIKNSDGKIEKIYKNGRN